MAEEKKIDFKQYLVLYYVEVLKVEETVCKLLENRVFWGLKVDNTTCTSKNISISPPTILGPFKLCLDFKSHQFGELPTKVVTKISLE